MLGIVTNLGVIQVDKTPLTAKRRRKKGQTSKGKAWGKFPKVTNFACYYHSSMNKLRSTEKYVANYV